MRLRSRTTSIALLVVAAGALGACARSVPAQRGEDARFLALVHSSLAGELSGWPDSRLLELGHRACQELDSGRSSDVIVADIGNNPDPGSAAFNAYSYVVVAAAYELCPAHKSEFGSIPAS